MAPSIKTLTAAFGKDKAVVIRGILTGKTSPEDFVSVKKWVGQCCNRPSQHEVQLEAINEVLDGYGTEALDEDTSWYPQPHYSYVNMGDPYTTTILYDHRRGTWIVSDWGAIAERFPNTGG